MRPVGGSAIHTLFSPTSVKKADGARSGVRAWIVNGCGFAVLMSNFRTDPAVPKTYRLEESNANDLACVRSGLLEVKNACGGGLNPATPYWYRQSCPDPVSSR